MDWLYDYLCNYDPRNPVSKDLLEPGETATVGCGCDNCFYGRHKLAEVAIGIAEAAAPFNALLQPDDVFGHGDGQPDSQGVYGINGAHFTVGDLRRLRKAMQAVSDGA